MPNADSSMKVVDVPLDQIFHDEKFNCRGAIPTSDVIPLAADIREMGLLHPITLQPWSLVPGKSYRIVCGHRREAAYRYNRDHKQGPATIPAIIHGLLTEPEALLMNLSENLNRKQLNFMQEARALRRLKDAGMSQSATAARLGKPRPWVQVRFYALNLPVDVQDDVEAGYIRQAHIHELNGKPRKEQRALAKFIKEAKIKAGNKRLRVTLPRPEDLLKPEVRDLDRVVELLRWMTDVGGVNPYTRTLAWVCGKVTRNDLLDAYRKYVEGELGKKWVIPDGGIPGL